MRHPELELRAVENETIEQRIIRKAAQIRRALIVTGIVISPDPDTLFALLPDNRRERWIRIARTYVLDF